MNIRLGVLVLALALVLEHASGAQTYPEPKPIPALLLVPQPSEQISFQRRGQELARYHYGSELRRPFIFPLIGPAGHPLTRLGHPRDPEGHRHHNSFWVAHHDVGGVSFWGDRGTNVGRIVHQRLEPLLDDAGEIASLISHNSWITESGQVLLHERRQTVLQLLPREEYFLVLDLQWSAPRAVTLGKTSFGPVAVRMVKSIGVHDGGGRMRSSEGATNEKEIFWKPARWVDYSGASAPGTIEGITLMDHPSNPNHPTVWHVRDDGWMGVSLTFDGPRTIEPGQPLSLRYGLYIHRGMPEPEVLNQRWREFSQIKLPEPAARKK